MDFSIHKSNGEPHSLRHRIPRIDWVRVSHLVQIMLRLGRITRQRDLIQIKGQWYDYSDDQLIQSVSLHREHLFGEQGSEHFIITAGGGYCWNVDRTFCMIWPNPMIHRHDTDNDIPQHELVLRMIVQVLDNLKTRLDQQ